MVLSQKGMLLIDAAGPRKQTGRVLLQDAKVVCPELVWEPPARHPGDLDAFLATLVDTTFKQGMLATTSESEKEETGRLRRSFRTPKPIKRLTTPVQPKVYRVCV